jgi:hypothetical protein
MSKVICLLLILITAVSAAIIPVTPLLAADRVHLTLDSSSSGIKLGDTFEVIIQAQSGSQEVVGVDVFLNFDASRLEVVDVDNVTAGIQILSGTTLKTVLWNSVSNSSGHIDYSAGKFSSFPTGTFTIATIRFKALGTTSTDTAVAFSTSTDRPTKIVGDIKATDVTGTLIGSTYTLIAPVIAGPTPGGGFVPIGSTQNIIYTHGFSSPAVFSSNSEGKALDSTTLVTSDGKASLFIPAGTALLDSNGNPLLLVTAEVMTEPPATPPLSKLIEAYAFGPSGAHFGPSIVLSLSYQSENLPQEVNEADLYVAYYDGASWVNLQSTVDTLTRTVKADISHFGSYALMSKLSPVLPSTTAINTPASQPAATTPILNTPTKTSPDLIDKPEITIVPSSTPLQTEPAEIVTLTPAIADPTPPPDSPKASGLKRTDIIVGLVVLLAISVVLGIIIGTRRNRLRLH